MSYASLSEGQFTPKQIAGELGISPKTLRAWLRKVYKHTKYQRWYFTAYEANRIIEAYREIRQA